MRRYFVVRIELGVQWGELRAGVAPDELAQLLVDLLWGLAMDLGFHSMPERMRRVLVALELLLSG